jgi:hypothetical protein
VCVLLRLAAGVVSVCMKLPQIVIKNVFHTSERTPCVHNTNTIRLMQCSYIIAVYRKTCAAQTVCKIQNLLTLR